MAIRQDRMIALINAAIAYRAEFERVQKWVSNRALDTMPPDELRAQIQEMGTIINEAAFQLAAQHSNTMFMEFTHFYRNQRLNTRKKAMMAIKRRESGIEPRAQPLYHFNETDKLEVRSDLMDQPRPLHVKIQGRTAQTVEEALQLEQQISKYNNTELPPEIVKAQAELEAEIAADPLSNKDISPILLQQDEEE